MPRTACSSHKPMYINTFPSWKGRQPLRFFMMENLLQARQESAWPTNGAGFDEDVNVFLAGLLTGFLEGKTGSDIQSGAGSLLIPPPATWSRRRQAEYYLANGNHRLLHLGLMNRGDGISRRDLPFGLNATEARQRDLGVGRTCYELAANLLQGRAIVSEGLVGVLEKLAQNFADYVQVFSVLATRRLGLGAHLKDHQLARLIDQTDQGVRDEYPARPLPADHPAMDRFLDQLLAFKKSPTPQREQGLKEAACQAGLDAESYLTGPRKIL